MKMTMNVAVGVLEGNYNLTGVGIKKNSKGVLFYTQIFLYQKQ